MDPVPILLDGLIDMRVAANRQTIRVDAVSVLRTSFLHLLLLCTERHYFNLAAKSAQPVSLFVGLRLVNELAAVPDREIPRIGFRDGHAIARPMHASRSRHTRGVREKAMWTLVVVAGDFVAFNYWQVAKVAMSGMFSLHLNTPAPTRPRPARADQSATTRH